MAMNFWEAQKRARSKTTLFIILFILLTAIMAAFIEMGMRSFSPEYEDASIPWLGLFFAGLTFLVAGFQYLRFMSQGGSVVAEVLGGKQVSRSTVSSKEQQLLNIVEEIAVASSLPIPAVYILPAHQINAFAAGTTPQNAVIGITEGTMQTLNRDELQGVVAHEFGHIYNADMKISMRLAAMLMGFFFIMYIGLRFLQMPSFQTRGDDKRGNPLVAAAFLFFIAGALTWFFGSILKAAVSREREYLADACAVQFTRNPDGIIGALRKIAKEQTSDMPVHGDAYSHMYFDDRSMFSSLFSTHPPLSKRIAAITGREYIPEEWNIP